MSDFVEKVDRMVRKVLQDRGTPDEPFHLRETHFPAKPELDIPDMTGVAVELQLNGKESSFFIWEQHEEWQLPDKQFEKRVAKYVNFILSPPDPSPN